MTCQAPVDDIMAALKASADLDALEREEALSGLEARSGPGHTAPGRVEVYRQFADAGWTVPGCPAESSSQVGAAVAATTTDRNTA